FDWLIRPVMAQTKTPKKTDMEAIQKMLSQQRPSNGEKTATADPVPAKSIEELGKEGDSEMLFVVYSSSAFLLNGVIEQYGNLDLLMNTVSYVMKDQDLIGIRPREINKASLNLTNDSFR